MGVELLSAMSSNSVLLCATGVALISTECLPTVVTLVTTLPGMQLTVCGMLWLAIAPQHITLPTEGEMAPTADRMYRKHGLPNFAYAVDGTHFRFDGVVKDIPIGPGKWWAS